MLACLSHPLSACLCLALSLLRGLSLIAFLVAGLLILPPKEGQGKREETKSKMILTTPFPCPLLCDSAL